MKKEDFFDILGDVNKQYVKEAYMQSGKKNTYAWVKWGTIAACLAVVVLCIPLVTQILPVGEDNAPTVESIPIVESTPINNNQEEKLQNSSKESSNVPEDLTGDIELQSRIEELSSMDSLGWLVYENRIYIQDLNIDTISLESNQNNIELSERLGRASDYTGAYQNTDACDGDVFLVVNNSDILCIKLDNGGTIWLGAEETTSATYNEFKEDVPADANGEYNEEITSGELTQNTSDFFGGSYTDANGRFVIVLTEDTPENRAAICKELGRSESNTTFVTGNYTLSYLTELQEKITNAMINNEIPFVVSSGVYEMSNCIIIRVTTNDEAELAKVYALDTVGGAIKVEYSSGAGTEDLEIAVTE